MARSLPTPDTEQSSKENKAWVVNGPYFETYTRYYEVDGEEQKKKMLGVFKGSFETYIRPGDISCK